MPNLPISTHKVGDGSLSWKEIKNKAEFEARRIKDEMISMKYNLVPASMETVKQSMNAVVDSATSMIDDKFKIETGMTIAEAKNKLDDGIQKFKLYKELGNSSKDKIAEKRGVKEEVTKKKAKSKKDLIEWLEKQSDTVYNAFFLVQAKEIIFEVKSVTAQMAEGGIDLCKETMDDLNNLKKFFPGGGDYKKDKPKEDVNLSIDYLNEDDGTAKTMLSELAKSAKIEGGEEYLSSTPLEKKGLSSTSKTILSLISSLLSLLAPFYTLIYNYNTNKNGLKADADKHSNEILRASAEKQGLTETEPAKPKTKKVNTKNNKDTSKRKEKYKQKYEENQDKKDEPKSLGTSLDGMSISSGTKEYNPEGTQGASMDFMKFLSEPDDNDEMEIPENITDKEGSCLASPSSDIIYVAPKSKENEDAEILFSELDRVNMKIDEVKDECKYDIDFTLISKSTKTNGGRFENLIHSGNNKKEIIESVLKLNGGRRL